MMKHVLATFDVDVQRGFTPLCPDELPVPGGNEIADELNFMASLGSIRVGSKDSHPANPVWIANESRPVMKPLSYPNADLAWPSHCAVGTEGHELLDGLPKPEEYDFFVWKGVERDLHPYGACYHDLSDRMSTGVIEYLKSVGVTDVVIGGLAYEHCVAKTASQLCSAGFCVVLYEPATRGIDESLISRARDLMQDEGVTIIHNQEQLISYTNYVLQEGR